MCSADQLRGLADCWQPRALPLGNVVWADCKLGNAEPCTAKALTQFVDVSIDVRTSIRADCWQFGRPAPSVFPRAHAVGRRSLQRFQAWLLSGHSHRAQRLGAYFPPAPSGMRGPGTGVDRIAAQGGPREEGGGQRWLCHVRLTHVLFLLLVVKPRTQNCSMFICFTREHSTCVVIEHCTINLCIAP